MPPGSPETSATHFAPAAVKASPYAPLNLYKQFHSGGFTALMSPQQDGAQEPEHKTPQQQENISTAKKEGQHVIRFLSRTVKRSNTARSVRHLLHAVFPGPAHEMCLFAAVFTGHPVDERASRSAITRTNNVLSNRCARKPECRL